jgi:hypothetical protein
MEHKEHKSNTDQWYAKVDELTHLKSLSEIDLLINTAPTDVITSEEYQYLCGYSDAIRECLDGKYQEYSSPTSNNACVSCGQSRERLSG